MSFWIRRPAPLNSKQNLTINQGRSEKMPEEHVMKAAMQTYIDSFNAGDAEGLISLLADDATIEDPVGSELVEGIEAIAEFYRGGVKVVTEMSLSAPIRGSHANAAAMAFDF